MKRTSENVKSLYRFWSPFYDVFLGIWYKVFAKKILIDFKGLLKKYVSGDKDILELGCGRGANLEFMKQLALSYKSYLGVDLTPEMLEIARKKHSNLMNTSFQQANIMNLRLDKKFDLIISTWVFSHLLDPANVVLKAVSYLKENGVVVLVFCSKSERHPLLSATVNGVLKLFSGEPLSETMIRRFPNVILKKRYLFGCATLMVLQKR